jgi:lipooligosaccharide transport system permease protein
MIALSGLFFTLDQLPSSLQIVAWGLPTTHSVTLMQGIWDGSGWTAHWGSVAGLVLMFGVSVWISTKVFRWE